MCTYNIRLFFTPTGSRARAVSGEETDMAQKPMTKTQLVAALADEMGSDKKTAGASARRDDRDRDQGSRRRRCRHGSPVSARSTAASGPERMVRNPATGEQIKKEADKQVKVTIAKALKGQRQRLIGPSRTNRERVAPGRRARPFLFSGRKWIFRAIVLGLIFAPHLVFGLHIGTHHRRGGTAADGALVPVLPVGPARDRHRACAGPVVCACRAGNGGRC